MGLAVGVIDKPGGRFERLFVQATLAGAGGRNLRERPYRDLHSQHPAEYHSLRRNNLWKLMSRSPIRFHPGR
jgi:hypothetical protein